MGVFSELVGWVARRSRGYRSVVVSWSGGKDSTLVLAAAARAAPEKLVAVAALPSGQYHPVAPSYLRAVAEELGLAFAWLGRVEPSRIPAAVEDVLSRHGTPVAVAIETTDPETGDCYWRALQRRGPPTIRYRWCTGTFKLWWLRRVAHTLPGKRLVLKATRAEERRGRPWSPVKTLRLSQVIEGLREAGIWPLVSRLYDLLPRSPDCPLCPLASPLSLLRSGCSLPRGLLLRVYSVLVGLDWFGLSLLQRRAAAGLLWAVRAALRGLCPRHV